VSEGNTLIQVSSEHKGTVLLATMIMLIMVFMLMWLTLTINSMRDTFKETKTEVRILQMHVQDQNAILIRAGITKPGDLTTGPTDPDKYEKRDDERD
jgi:hypothetical protein